MPAKKNQVNGFWLFAQDHRPDFKRQGLSCDSNAQLLSLASTLWKSLPPEKRKEWDAKAKDERKVKKRNDMDRLDNVGQIIGLRKDPFEEARKRREREIISVTSKWAGKDLRQVRFYIIYIEHLVCLTPEDNLGGSYLPREIALAEYTLKHGIMKSYHQFIWPCPEGIPVGFNWPSREHSELTHKIPVEPMTEYDDSSNFARIWQQMLDTVKDGMKDGQYPPLYCLTVDYDRVKYMVDWLWERSGSPLCYANPLEKIYSLDEIISSLFAHSGKEEAASTHASSIASRLDGSQWEYIRETACDFHVTVDVSRYCALACVKRCCYTISDMLAPMYNIDLSDRHVPAVLDVNVEEPIGKVLPMDAGGPNSRLGKRGRGRLLGGYAVSATGDAPPGRRGGTKNMSETASVCSSTFSDDEDMSGPGHLTREQAMAAADASRERWKSYTPGQAVMSTYGGVASVGASWKKPGERLPPPGPTSGQFDDSDWPSLGGDARSSQSETFSQDGESSPTKGIAKMSLAGVSSGWMASGGRGTTTALPRPSSGPVQSPYGTASAQNQPGLVGLGRGAGRGYAPDIQGVGRGMAPPSSSSTRPPPPLARTQEPDAPTPSSSSLLPMGRGGVPVGVGRGAGGVVTVGRGMSGASVGRGSAPVKGQGVGRGYAQIATQSASLEPGYGGGEDFTDAEAFPRLAANRTPGASFQGGPLEPGYALHGGGENFEAFPRQAGVLPPGASFQGGGYSQEANVHSYGAGIQVAGGPHVHSHGISISSPGDKSEWGLFPSSSSQNSPQMPGAHGIHIAQGIHGAQGMQGAQGGAPVTRGRGLNPNFAESGRGANVGVGRGLAPRGK